MMLEKEKEKELNNFESGNNETSRPKNKKEKENEKNNSHQYLWDGSDDIKSVFEYSHSLGPKGSFQFQFQSPSSSSQLESQLESQSQSTHILSLSMEEVQKITLLQSSNWIWTGDENSQNNSEINDLELFKQHFILKINEFLSNISNSSNQKWFLKTNRHSCKDSPLDHPTENDLQIFKNELNLFPTIPLNISNIDEIDFGVAFLAMCRSRLESTAVRNGNDVLSLLIRSKRIYDDFILQLRICPLPWDCYLAFTSYDDEMAKYPLHEFRCYISNRQIRCIMQYSYLITCPISSQQMPYAIKSILNYLNDQFIPSIPNEILDLVVDLQCIPLSTTSEEEENNLYQIKFIETNPLGPGTVWGHLSWDVDRSWLLFNPEDGKNTSILPSQGHISDTQGGERVIEWYPSIDNEKCHCVVLYTSHHPLGMVWGGIAHIPADYLLIVWEKWNLQRLQQENNSTAVNENNKDDRKVDWNCIIN